MSTLVISIFRRSLTACAVTDELNILFDLYPHSYNTQITQGKRRDRRRPATAIHDLVQQGRHRTSQQSKAPLVAFTSIAKALRRFSDRLRQFTIDNSTLTFHLEIVADALDARHP